MQKLFRKTWLKGCWIGGISFLILAVGYRTDLLKRVETRVQDLKFSIRGFETADSKVFLIGIDDLSIDLLGRWIWPRSRHAALLQVLSIYPPAALGFDILFHLPSEDRPDWDQDLIEMSKQFDALTYASFFREEKTVPNQRTEVWIQSTLEKTKLPKIDLKKILLKKAKEIYIPIQGLSSNAHIGFINAPPDPDGSIRKVPLIFEYEGQAYPSFALKLFMDYLNLSGADVEIGAGPTLRLMAKNGVIEIPVDRQGNYHVNFRSDLSDFQSSSFVQVLKNGVKLNDKIAVVGLTATGVSDFAPTPLSPHTPLVMVHLNILQNFMQKDFLRLPSLNVQLMILFFVSILAGWMSYTFRKIWATIGIFIFFFGFGILNVFVFARLNCQIYWMGPSLAIILNYLMSTTWRYWIEEKEKRYVKKAFQKYISPAVLEKILKDPKNLELGGKRQTLTVLFSDIRGFSTYCEKRSPEEIIMMLNEYFSLMTRIVFDHGGTLDKYLGDGLMAIFGAPAHLEIDPAVCAIRAAFEMQEQLKSLRERWILEKKEPFYIGIGINTGPMVVGNMGSSFVMNYTVVGDEVNLAARLEGLTRQFNADVIISRSTYEKVKHEWEVKCLGEVRVKGREQMVEVYELIGRK